MLLDGDLVAQLAGDDVESAVEPLVQVGLAPFVLADVGEVLQGLNNVLYALEPVHRFAQQVGGVVLHEAQVGLGAGAGQARQRRRRRVMRGDAGLVLFDEPEQGRHIIFQRAHVGVDEADRVVDFVRNAGGQLADRGHLLGLPQLLVGLLQSRDQHLLRFATARQRFLDALALGNVGERPDHFLWRAAGVAHQAQGVVHPAVTAVGGAKAVFVRAVAFDKHQRQAGENVRRVVRMNMVEPEIRVGDHLARLVAEHVDGVVADESELEIAAGNRAVDDGGGVVDQTLQALERRPVRAAGRQRCGRLADIKILELHRHHKK